MSLRTDALVRELVARVTELERRLDAIGKPVELDMQQLRSDYQARFGRPPHHRMAAETIAAALA